MPGLSFFVNSGSLGSEASRLATAAAAVHLSVGKQMDALADTIRRIYTGMARGEAPRRTGKLGSEIKGEITRNAGGISINFTSTSYTRYVIEGTGLYHTPDAHDVIRPKRGRVLRFEIDGQVLYRAFVRGQHPNDFASRAWTRSQPGIEAALKLTANQVLVSFIP